MTEKSKANNLRPKKSRRSFLRTGLSGAAGLAMLTCPDSFKLLSGHPGIKNGNGLNTLQNGAEGELLYNGIKLPPEWPPRNMNPDSWDPMPIPYLAYPPEVINVDTGRQLFVDDFLIEFTNLKRQFHQPVKYEGNPVLKPETESEKNNGFCPVAAPFSDGVFYDPEDDLFKLWYMAGWFDGTALAYSKDGKVWTRPEFDVVHGTNLVLPSRNEFRRDGLSVWLDHEADNPAERFKMYVYERVGKIGEKLTGGEGYQLTSPDGIHWNWRGRIGKTGDNSTFFYNPFRKKWVFTVRTTGRLSRPWETDPNWGGSQRGRSRSYWDNNSFLAALDGWDNYDPVFWLGADKLDNRRSKYDIGSEPQLYKVDAVGYESLMLGLIQLHYGPPNETCAKGGYPKLTELQIAFSRDGFHWDRTNRQTFIGAKPDEKNSWERGYIHSVGGVCNIVGDSLYFYYTAFRGDETNLNPNQMWSGMYANASTGLAILRRDGFASMHAGAEGILLTRMLNFSGNYLFVNIDGSKGKLYAEICTEDGKPIVGFTRNDCIPVSADSTKCIIKWKQNDSLHPLAGKPVRLKFYLTNSIFYAFWISQTDKGHSSGATAAGGPGLSGTWDTDHSGSDNIKIKRIYDHE